MPAEMPPRIVVAGSGLAGYGVLRELRKLAPDARLTLITADDGHFYSKPALSTALAKGRSPTRW
jgi:rubredoxin-NAD+ reductase